jgi:hypothetical protein
MMPQSGDSGQMAEVSPSGASGFPSSSTHTNLCLVAMAKSCQDPGEAGRPIVARRNFYWSE